MHQLVAQKSHHKDLKLHRLESDHGLLLHKTMPLNGLLAYQDLASTSKQTPTVQNASASGVELHLNKTGGLTARAASNMNRLSYIGLPQQLDLERNRPKINRESLDHHHGGAAETLARDNLKQSRVNLHQPAGASTLDRVKKTVQTIDPSKFIDFDRLPSNYSQPFLVQHRDLLKGRQTSFLSDNIASNNLIFGVPRSSQTSHQEDSRKEEDLLLKNSTDSNNKLPADFSNGKNSGIVLVEVQDPEDSPADRHEEEIQIEDGRTASHIDKLTKMLLQSEILKTDEDIETCQSTLRDLRYAAERIKRASEELVRGRDRQIKLLEAKFEAEKNSLHQQLDYETTEYKKLWKKMMDC